MKKITGIITQGAKSLGKEMYVTSYALQYSDNGIHWNQYTDDEEEVALKVSGRKIVDRGRYSREGILISVSSLSHQIQTFSGNTDNNGHMKNYIYPPIFSRFIRILPRRWTGSITMRVELLGCDFE